MRGLLLVQRDPGLGVRCFLGVYFRMGLRRYKPGAEPNKLDRQSSAAQEEAEYSLARLRRIVPPPARAEADEMAEAVSMAPQQSPGLEWLALVPGLCGWLPIPPGTCLERPETLSL